MDALRKPHEANSSPLTPIVFLERAATVYGDSPSIIYNHLTYTWTDTFRRCLRLASSISRLAVGKHDVVSVLAPNIPATYELHFAVTMTGAVINTINTRLDARTISVILHHGESKLVFVDYNLTNLILQSISMLPHGYARPKLVVITEDGGVLPSSLGTEFINSYEDMVEAGDPEFTWVRPETDWDPLTLNYTSGTTSSPKGVLHSHRGTFIGAFSSLLDWFVPKQPVYLWTLPMFHANGWSYVWGMAAVGATNVCLRRFDASTIHAAIHNHRVTHMCGAPVVLNMLSECEPLGHKVQIMTGGAPPPAAVLERIESLGFEVTHGYGLTETNGLSVICAWNRQWDRLPETERARLKARQGVKSLGMTTVSVVDETGMSVIADGVTMGEIVLNGGCVMLGYLKDGEGTDKCIRNGWFYTGDVGVMHPDGYLEIKDRSKDIIISGGENVSTVEVESVLYTHPAVNEVAVVGRPDEFWGETPCAFVKLKGEGVRSPVVTAEEMMRFCRSKLPGFMVPKTVVFREELPKTATGKIQKNVLREIAGNIGVAGKGRL